MGMLSLIYHAPISGVDPIIFRICPGVESLELPPRDGKARQFYIMLAPNFADERVASFNGFAGFRVGSGFNLPDEGSK